MQMVPAGPERTLETIDFYFEKADLTEAETESIRYIDEVLQPEDVSLVESVQRGMRTPAFTQGAHRVRPGRLGPLRARGSPLPRPGTRRLPPRRGGLDPGGSQRPSGRSSRSRRAVGGAPAAVMRCLAVDEAGGAGRGEASHQPALVDHGLAVLVPVGVR